MARRRVKKTVKEAASSPESTVDGNHPQIEEKETQVPLIDQEVERQSAAIRAMRDVEIEHSLTGLRLLRSYFNEGQLQTPVLHFFKENLPNLSIIKNGKNAQFEVQWNDKDDNLSMSEAPGGRDLHASLLHRLSIAYSDCSVIPSLGGIELSSDAGNGEVFLSFFCANMRIDIWFLLVLSKMVCLIGGSGNQPVRCGRKCLLVKCLLDEKPETIADFLGTQATLGPDKKNFSISCLFSFCLDLAEEKYVLFLRFQLNVLEGPSDSQMLGDGLRTPGATSQRLSIGMTPKTLRLPKPGEMLLSVRGSPLGVYKEDNMEAIQESEEG
ncbi:uncharacterized protein LOC110671028 [Hevea brasiliensis]|uniref:uncharacterized protein LOC110671028 n=1 Tax=Hevea brasiliensis TaxID=3981 RepID=UPI00260052D5|nr:uncharacterized protein LOC110671028 [Hevea brasiliensis]